MDTRTSKLGISPPCDAPKRAYRPSSKNSSRSSYKHYYEHSHTIYQKRSYELSESLSSTRPYETPSPETRGRTESRAYQNVRPDIQYAPIDVNFENSERFIATQVSNL